MKHTIHLLLIFSLLALGGCGILDTREPDNPTGSSDSGDLALSANEAIAQLETAIALHDPSLYMAAISEEFTCNATLSAFPDDPFYFENWNRAREDVFIRSLLAQSLIPPDSTSGLIFSAIEEVSYADSAVYRESYQLVIAPMEADLPTVYGGFADLVLKREEDGGWRIVRWIDDAGGDYPTLSQLRAAL